MADMVRQPVAPDVPHGLLCGAVAATFVDRCLSALPALPSSASRPRAQSRRSIGGCCSASLLAPNDSSLASTGRRCRCGRSYAPPGGGPCLPRRHQTSLASGRILRCPCRRTGGSPVTSAGSIEPACCSTSAIPASDSSRAAAEPLVGPGRIHSSGSCLSTDSTMTPVLSFRNRIGTATCFGSQQPQPSIAHNVDQSALCSQSECTRFG